MGRKKEESRWRESLGRREKSVRENALDRRINCWALTSRERARNYTILSSGIELLYFRTRTNESDAGGNC